MGEEGERRHTRLSAEQSTFWKGACAQPNYLAAIRLPGKFQRKMLSGEVGMIMVNGMNARVIEWPWLHDIQLPVA
jgi:hypothetical protein